MRSFFNLQQHNTTVQTEILAGISTFLATAYIIVVNPSVLSKTGMPFSGVLTATVLLCFFSSLLMGLYAKNPVVVAPGMGLNAFFTYTAVMVMGISWQTALGAVFWSGIFFLILSVFNIRTYIVKAIPKPLRYAIAAGIGLFITLIGLENSGFIIKNDATILAHAPISAAMLIFVAGLLLTAILLVKRIKGAILIGIIVTTLLSAGIGRWWTDSATIVSFKGVFAAPDFSLVGKMDIWGSLKLSVLPVIFAFVFTDLFDSLSTLVGLSEAANLVDENGDPRNIKQALVTDAVSTTIAGIVGCSPGTAYIESAVGIEEGGRTGLTAVIAALLFLPFLFLAPLLSMIPPVATAPALVLVGSFMLRPVTKINWMMIDEAIPAFIAMVVIPFTYSITQGIIWGFLSWTIIKMAAGKTKDISLALIIIDVFCVLALAMG
ncbi:MAG TPA: NCS2 family permease [Parafilimonas sp.]|nr:NCS2 family permease [Parafilimonas sp.]